MQSPETLNLRGWLRPLLYSSAIFTVLYLLTIQKYFLSKEHFLFFAFLGGVLLFEEFFFTVYYVNVYSKKKIGHFEHLINHSLYPQIFYLGLIVYMYIQDDYIIGFVLSVLGFLMYFLHFYMLPQHLHDDHIDSIESHKGIARVDFVLHIFKFASYFAFNVALFELYIQGNISDLVLLVTNISINFFYLLAHLNRKYETTYTNIFVTFLFAILSSIAIFSLKMPTSQYNASIATLVFYLAAGIFYHKLDGSFTYKVVLEYATIALILSIFIFAV